MKVTWKGEVLLDVSFPNVGRAFAATHSRGRATGVVRPLAVADRHSAAHTQSANTS